MPPHNYFSERKVAAPVTVPVTKFEEDNPKMSILSKVENGIKTLAHEAEDALKVFVKDEPKIEAVAATTLKTVSPLVIATVGVISANPAVAAAAASTIAAIQTSLAAAQVIVVSLDSATSAKALLNQLVADLQSLLTLVGVKDPALVATITADVNKIVLALQVIIAAL